MLQELAGTDLGGHASYCSGILEHRESEGKALESGLEPHAFAEPEVLRQVDSGPLGEIAERLPAERAVEVTVKIGERRGRYDDPNSTQGSGSGCKGP